MTSGNLLVANLKELKPDAKPLKNLPHRASPRQRQMIDEEVDKL